MLGFEPIGTQPIAYHQSQSQTNVITEPPELTGNAGQPSAQNVSAQVTLIGKVEST